MTRKRIATLGGATAVALLSTMCVWSFWPTVGVDVPLDQARVPEWLPPTTERMSYYIAGTFGPASYWEFDVDEAGLRGVGRSPCWELEAAERPEEFGMPLHVYRSQAFRTPERPEEYALVFRSLHAAWFDPSNPDSGWSITDDRDAGRAYYSVHSR